MRDDVLLLFRSRLAFARSRPKTTTRLRTGLMVLSRLKAKGVPFRDSSIVEEMALSFSSEKSNHITAACR